MLKEGMLKDLLTGNLKDQEKVLVCLAVEPVRPLSVKEINDLAFCSGWRQIKKKNVSSILSRLQRFVFRSTSGWELTTAGVNEISRLVPSMETTTLRTATLLRTYLTQISHLKTRSFVEEAVHCFEAHQFRAAIVLSWVGAVSVLQQFVITNKLVEFNEEAFRRSTRWKEAKTSDGLSLMRENEFLDVLQAISVIGKNVKQELQKALTLRNGCGHPNSLIIAEHKAASHIEDLILNVFSTYT